MKKVLIILFYWPPAGGSSVQRWLRFSKYLRDFGWDPVIYAPENASYLETDPTLINEIPPGIKVIRKSVFEPQRILNAFSFRKSKKAIGVSMTMSRKPSGFSGILLSVSIWIRGNIFIPDSRMFWISPSVGHLRKYLRDEPVDAIITTGPPHSMHLIGKSLRKHIHIPWIADFRDPWTSIDFYKDLKVSRFADRLHRKLESRVLHQADHVIAVSPSMEKEFTAKGAKAVSVITNGYDTAESETEPVEADRKFSIVHIGTIGKNRNAPGLWKVLAEKVSDDPGFAADLEIKLTGNVDFSVFDEIRSHGLESFLKHTEYVAHREVLDIMKRGRVLLLLINTSENSEGILTGKFFEYMAASRPILLLGPEGGDAARILEACNLGYSAGHHDLAKIRTVIDTLYSSYKSGNLVIDPKDTGQYSRKALTGKLAAILDRLTQQG